MCASCFIVALLLSFRTDTHRCLVYFLCQNLSQHCDLLPSLSLTATYCALVTRTAVVISSTGRQHSHIMQTSSVEPQTKMQPVAVWVSRDPGSTNTSLATVSAARCTVHLMLHLLLGFLSYVYDRSVMAVSGAINFIILLTRTRPISRATEPT